MKKCIVIIMLIVLIIASACAVIKHSWYVEEKEYYSDKENFVECKAIIKNITHNEKNLL